jgi:hypothetical protein
MHPRYFLESLKKRDYLGDLGIDDRIILEWILEKQGGKIWIGCIWLRTRTSEKLL